MRSASSIGPSLLVARPSRIFSGASDQPGCFQLELAVYGKKGEDCPRCGEEIVKEVIGGRATFFCLGCQKDTRR
ncbi:MAG: hypothetical protein D3917_01710 [Candidatus Electrothrix sp. AX5]|nr:hypothetical protein [Candidatus Electrothrix sp. AX5]